MKKLFITFILLYLNTSYASDNNAKEEDLKTINNPEELNKVCKEKSIGYFKEKNKTPSNWVSQWRIEGSLIDVKGEWEVGNTKYTVTCRIKQGLNESTLLLSIKESRG